MKKYYISGIILLNSINNIKINAEAATKSKTIKELADLGGKIHRYSYVHDETKITTSLDAYVAFETLKLETEQNIRKANEDGRAILEKYYNEYKELSSKNASESELQACASKIQKQSEISENKVRLLQEEFQMESYNTANSIRETVKEAVEVVCSRIHKNLEANHKSTDIIIVSSENRDNLLGLTKDQLDSIDITDLVIEYLKEKGKISKKKSSNIASKGNKKGSNRANSTNKTDRNKNRKR